MPEPTGIVFDIKQLSVFDGPGIRTTVFFKGCPLRCQWCHNPEGLDFKPQLMVSSNGCTQCGKCLAVCPSPNHCMLCGRCTHVCPLGLRRICGKEYTIEALSALLLKDADYLRENGGGYTISGGEPTSSPSFLIALLKRLSGNHRIVETSGYCPTHVFEDVLQNVECVLMDLKLVDGKLHKLYTGVDNVSILQNLEVLKQNGKPFVIRIPVIPGVNDTDANYSDTIALLKNCPSLVSVELLPYHQTAGAKYSMIGKQYTPDFDPTKPIRLEPELFLKAGIACSIP